MAVSQNISRFVEEFNKLEDYLRRRGNYSSYDSIASVISKEALKNPVIRQHKDDPDSFRELRNALTHLQGVYAEPFAEPYPATVERLAKISHSIMNPPRASNIAIKKIMSVSYDDSLLPSIQLMRDKGYSTLPVLEDGVIKYVLSEYSLLKWVASEAQTDGATLVAQTIRDISHHLDLPTAIDTNASYVFISIDTLLNEIISLFENAVKNGQRLNAIFVTHHGKPTEKVQGIITAWDLAGISKL